MRAGVAILTVVAFASVPLWLRDPYLMNALITTGIFIIGAMSLNLLLGFTGQLSLGQQCQDAQARALARGFQGRVHSLERQVGRVR